MRIRDLILGAAIGVVVFYAAMNGLTVPAEIDQRIPSTQQVSTEEPIYTVTADSPLTPNYKNVTFYESGAIEIFLNPRDTCFNVVSFKHRDSSQNYRTFDMPEFEGPIVFDGRSVVKANAPYPNRRFQLVMDNNDDDYFCAAAGGEFEFEVPANWTK